MSSLDPLQFRLNVRVQDALKSMKVARTCTSPHEPPFSPLPLSGPTFVCWRESVNFHAQGEATAHTSYQACSTTILQPKPSTQTSQSTRCFPSPLSPASGRAVVAGTCMGFELPYYMRVEDRYLLSEQPTGGLVVMGCAV